MSDEIKLKIEDRKKTHEEAQMRLKERHQELVAEHKNRMNALRENFDSLRQAHKGVTAEVKKTEDTSST